MVVTGRNNLRTQGSGFESGDTFNARGKKSGERAAASTYLKERSGFFEGKPVEKSVAARGEMIKK